MSASRASVRLDVQVLRAVAVGAVLLYHLWPNRFTGGYVGVDVFFVISGFLITAHLLRHAQDEGRVSLVGFWANRSRRLLPMACLVLVLTAVASLVWLPASSWGPALRGVLASTFYVQNWNLAGESVSYLARDYIVGPTQHFWSLSVEEQFYIVWPLVFVLTTALAVRVLRRRGAGRVESSAKAHVSRVVLVRRYAVVAVAVIFVSSLAYSLWVTATAPSLSYFSTFGRAWEFAAGALLAVLPGKFGADAAELTSLSTRVLATSLGYSTLFGTVLFLPAGVLFPGAIALLPVIGTALVIWAGDVRGAVTPALLARVRPVVALGDISYSVYLWHWPIIVILPYALGRGFTTLDKLLVIGASVGLAALSKPLIEDRFRRGRVSVSASASASRGSQWRGFVPGGVGMLVAGAVAATSLVVFVPTLSNTDGSSVEIASADAATDPNAPLVPGLAVRTEDKGGMYDCFAPSNGPLQRCEYGEAGSDVRIALIGDSHAAHLIPGLVSMVEARGWSLSTFVGMRCDEGPAELCAGAPATIEALVAEGFDLVLAGGYRASDSPVANVEAYWSSLLEQGIRLVPVVDVPLIPEPVYACLDASGGDPLVADRCEISFADGLEAFPDRATLLAERLGLPTIDLTHRLCTAEACQAVVGNTIVYQDSPSSHLTATFSRALGEEFGAHIERLLSEPS